jgi:hypothetical protein
MVAPVSVFGCLLLCVCVFNNSVLGCPVGQYPSSDVVPHTCLHCPAHTRTSDSPDSALSVHDCKCVAGFLCLYYKQVHATVTLNTTLADFEENAASGARSAFVSGVASAAGVGVEQVHIHFVVIRLHQRRRRLLHSYGPHSGASLLISVVIPGVETGSLASLRKHVDTLRIGETSWLVQRRILVLPVPMGEGI